MEGCLYGEIGRNFEWMGFFVGGRSQGVSYWVVVWRDWDERCFGYVGVDVSGAEGVGGRAFCTSGSMSANSSLRSALQLMSSGANCFSIRLLLAQRFTIRFWAPSRCNFLGLQDPASGT